MSRTSTLIKVRKLCRRISVSLLLAGLSGAVHAQCTYPAPSISGSQNLICGQSTTLTAIGAGTHIRWFNAPTGGKLLSTSSSYTTPVLSIDDTVWVEAVDLVTTAQTQATFSSVGQHTFTVPAGVYQLNVDLSGAQGGTYSGYTGGYGGRVVATISVTPGETLYINVGGTTSSTTGGSNGGGAGSSNGRGGGGASDIRKGGTGTQHRIVVAAGGGGGGYYSAGAHGGYPNGNDASFYYSSYQSHGGGATQTDGGARGSYSTSVASMGALYSGGSGTYGGGGGGGYYGGGGGYYDGGGGGSSWVNPQYLVGIPSYTGGYKSGAGQVTISWQEPACSSPRTPVPIHVTNILAAPTVSGIQSIVCGQTTTLTATGSGTEIRWYDAPVGGTLLASGNSYTTPALTQNDTIWVETLNLTAGQASYTSPGEYMWEVPNGVYQLNVDMYGARGGSASYATGGYGGRVRTTISVTPGEILYIYVGGTSSGRTGGFNGGGHASSTQARGGGGASDIRTVASDPNTRIVVAAGGGGAGYYSSSTSPSGGSGGAPNGSTGGVYTGTAGGGATQSGGGSASSPATAGALYRGGHGGNGTTSTSYGAGGGGGGYYGGGGGYYSAGGGGGSSWVSPARIIGSATYNGNTASPTGNNGAVYLTWEEAYCVSARVPVPISVNTIVPQPTVSGTTVTCGFPATLTATGSYGYFRWYDSQSGGSPISSTATYTTPNIFGPQTYYVEAWSVNSTPNCKSERVAVLVDQTPVPNPVVTPDTVICGNAATLQVSGSTQMFNWYSAASGGTRLDTGASLTRTPLSTTTYYVEATSDYFPVGNLSFSYTGGQQTWVVPPGVTSINVDMAGAQGGSTSYKPGGNGGRVQATISVTPGETLYVYVGGTPSSTTGGYNGGGNGVSSGRGGGGGTDIRIGGTGTGNRVIVAAGGGGAGYYSSSTSYAVQGGPGGYPNGQAGSGYYYGSSAGGGGATQSAGGGVYSSSATAGALFQGGNGYSNGGGGGGGYYGGGGGYYDGGGGGGSSWVASARLIGNATYNGGTQTGNGYVTISWNKPFCTSPRIPVVAVVENLPSPTVVGDTVACSSAATLSVSGSSGNYRWFTQASGGTHIAQGSVLNTLPIYQPATYYVEAYNPNNTCVSQRLPVQIYMDSLPAPVVSGHDTICDIGSTTFIASGGTGTITWHSTPGGPVIHTGSSYATGTVTAPVYMYVRESSGSCLSPFTPAVLEIVPTPDAGIIGGSSFCTSDPIQQFSAPSAGGLWSGTGIVGQQSGLFDPSVAGSGSHQIAYYVDHLGCVDTDTIQVSVIQGPVVTVTTPAPMCEQQAAISLSSSTSGGTWTGPGIMNGASGLFDPVQAGPGTHAVVYSVISGGCTGSDTAFVQVNPLPNAGLIAVGPLCSTGAPVQIGVQTPGGIFSGSGITDSSLGIFDPSVASAGTHTLYYTVTENGCSAVDSMQVVVNATPSATITAPGSYCHNQQSVTLTAGTPGGVWSGSGIQDAILGIFSPSAVGIGQYWVKYTISQNGCMNADSAQIQVMAAPVVNISPTGLQQACEGNGVTLQASGAGSYQWYLNGQPLSGANGSSYTALQSGSYSVEGIQGGCGVLSSSVPVQLNARPEILSITAPAACEGQAMVLGSQAVVSGNQGAVISSYIWDFGDGSSGPGYQVQHQYAAAGSYTVTLVATTNQGCSDTLSQTVWVNPLPQVTSVNVPNVCAPMGTSFNASASVSPINNSTVQNYMWQFGDGLNGMGASTAHTYQAPGTYTWVLQVVSNHGCVTQTTGLTEVYRKPVANFMSNNTCLQSPTQFLDISDGQGDAIVGWSWNFGDNQGTSTQQNPVYNYTGAPGQYPVSLTVQTASGCTDTKYQLVTLYPAPDASWNSQSAGGFAVQFMPNVPNSAASYMWHFPDDNSYYSQQNVTKTFAEEGEYDVCLTVMYNGCTSESCSTVTVTSMGAEAQAGVSMMVYPNPSVGKFHIMTSGLTIGDDLRYQVKDMAGRVVLSGSTAALSFEVDGTGLPAGSYLLSVRQNGAEYHTRLIIQP